jgi:hypothetical protein
VVVGGRPSLRRLVVGMAGVDRYKMAGEDLNVPQAKITCATNLDATRSFRVSSEMETMTTAIRRAKRIK